MITERSERAAGSVDTLRGDRQAAASGEHRSGFIPVLSTHPPTVGRTLAANSIIRTLGASGFVLGRRNEIRAGLDSRAADR